MAIIKCPQCGGQLSTSAPACPRCQHVPTEEEISLATSIVSPTQRSEPAGAILSDKAAKAIRGKRPTKKSHTGRNMVLFVGLSFGGAALLVTVSVFPSILVFAALGIGIVGAFIWLLRG